MKALQITFTLLLVSGALWSQNDGAVRLSNEDKIDNVISNFFYGLNNGDTSSITLVSYDNVTLRTTYNNQNGIPKLKEENYADFLKTVAAPRKNKWEEQISDIEIKVDDNLATAWMNYSFYVDDKLSHCGVNSFEFFNTPEGWKIISIIDTRRKDPCDEAK